MKSIPKIIKWSDERPIPEEPKVTTWGDIRNELKKSPMKWALVAEDKTSCGLSYDEYNGIELIHSKRNEENCCDWWARFNPEILHKHQQEIEKSKKIHPGLRPAPTEIIKTF